MFSSSTADRPDPTRPETLHDATKAVHIGNDVDQETKAIRRPLVMANSYELPEDPSEVNWSAAGPGLYTRNGGANQLWLEERLAALENGEAAAALASGVAALHAVFFTFLRSGDHVVVSDVTYAAVYRLFDTLLPERYGITATFVDTSDLEAVAAAITPQTKLIHTETPANPTTRISDVPALADLAHQHGALLTVDATLASPLLLRPLDLGADLVVHSLTKYINGHGDAVGGAVIGAEPLIRKIKDDAVVNVGGAISPFNAWLITRGSVTLPLRIAQHSRTAQAIAEFLASETHGQQPRIAFVAYPGLPTHPQHELAKQQMPHGYGGVLSFALTGGAQTQNAFVANLRIITSAVSLGHDETLIAYVGKDDDRIQAYPEEFQRQGYLRLSVGLEDASDLLRDISAALQETFH